MTNSDAERRIAALEAELAQLRAEQVSAPPNAPVVGDLVSGDKAAGDKVAGDKQQGAVDLSGGARADMAVGLNLGTVIYGRPPADDERLALVRYLERLTASLCRLPLQGLEDRLADGDGLALPNVYIGLATTAEVEVARGRTRELRRFYEDGKLDQPLKPEYAPDQALPDVAIVRAGDAVSEARRGKATPPRVLWRARLAAECAASDRCLVLLGDPGAGKSTFLRHLAWGLARRSLDQPDAPPLPGWPADQRALPVLLPLRKLAGRIEREGAAPATVRAALCAELRALGIAQPDAVLDAALDRDAALLLFDGLDEVPLERVAGVTADRATALRAVRDFAQLHARARALLTCRTRAFDEHERAALGWPVETLAPFTIAQVRAFVGAWYSELVAKNQLTPAQKERLAQALLAAATDPLRPRLREMAQTPLLLTLMALVLYTRRELPRDRPQLYERMLDLLLGQWDKLRDGETLADAIGQPDWTAERILPLLDRLSYEAHADARSQDGRGRLQRSAVYTALLDFFKQAKVPQPGDKADRCLDYLNRRSGLLVPDNAQDSYTFAHLTLQEYCAGRQIALNSDDPMALIRIHRDDDRWREPILLGMGLVHPSILNSVLADLIDREEEGGPKPPARWYRDLILAAEIGKDRDWDTLRTRPLIKVERRQRELRAGLVALLADKSQPLPVAERVRAGFLLGELGDPRYPVTPEQWREQIERAWAGDTGSYFCRVEAGDYIIGSADDDPDAQDAEKPQHTITIARPFLIGRYPVTNDQWQAWVAAGGQSSYSSDTADLNGHNQPGVGVTWKMCNAFCEWLSQQVDATIRLPSEREWEAAARGGDARRYPWGNTWQADRAATKEDQEARGTGWSAPIGCYPAGAAPTGALDIAGNVWDWTSDVWQSYPGAEESFTNEDWPVLRGGGFFDNSTYVRCGARVWDLIVLDLFNYGFRVVVAPALAQMS